MKILANFNNSWSSMMYQSNILWHLFYQKPPPDIPSLIKIPTNSYTMNPSTDTYKHSSKHFYYCHNNPIERLALFKLSLSMFFNKIQLPPTST